MPHSTDAADADRTSDPGVTSLADGTADADRTSPGGTAAGRAPEAGAAEAAVDPDAIGVLRGQIDALDKAIARLVAERAKLSARIQSARLDAGGNRIELGRERTILGHYRTRLGNEGAALAEAVLRLCRGVR